MRFKDKNILVTGAGRGIGRAIALGFASEGASIAINAAHLSSAEDAAHAAREFGGKVIAIEADTANEAQVEDMMGRVLKELGGIDVLVNNAGVSQPLMPLVEQDVVDFDRTVAINLRGTYLCCRAAAKGMIGQGGGKRNRLFQCGPGRAAAVVCLKIGVQHPSPCDGAVVFEQCYSSPS